MMQVFHPPSQVPAPVIQSQHCSMAYACREHCVKQRRAGLAMTTTISYFTAGSWIHFMITPSPSGSGTALPGNCPVRWFGNTGCWLSWYLLHGHHGKEGQLGSSLLPTAPVTQWPEPVTWAWLTAGQSSWVPTVTDFSGNERHTVRCWMEDSLCDPRHDLPRVHSVCSPFFYIVCKPRLSQGMWFLLSKILYLFFDTFML